jgi:hypothetical protein
VPQACGEDLFELGQGAEGRLLDAGDGAAGGGPQAQGDGDGLVVVEQQRRELRPGTEAVAARAGGGVHGIAEVAQLLDVAAHGPRVHLEPPSQFRAGPFARRLQETQEAQQAGGRLEHDGSLAAS